MKLAILAALMATTYASDCVDKAVTDAKKELKVLTDERDQLITDLKTETDQVKTDRLAALKDGDNALIKAKEGDLTIAKNSCVSSDAGGNDDAPVSNDDDTPVPVQVDAANSAVTKAAQEITTFDSQIELAEKLAAKYDTMDLVSKQSFDASLKLKAEARKKFLDAEKITAGFDKLTSSQQEAYLLKYDTWRKAFQDKCDTAKKAGKEDPECTHGEDLRKKQVAKQVKDKYYEKSAEDQKKDDDLYKTQKTQDLAGIEAAAKPAEGTGTKASAGGACKKVNNVRPTCSSGYCCGTASEKTEGDAVSSGLGALGGILGVNLGAKGDEICHTSTSTTYTKQVEGKDKLYNFKCIVGGVELAATALSVAAATFMMA